IRAAGPPPRALVTTSTRPPPAPPRSAHADAVTSQELGEPARRPRRAVCLDVAVVDIAADLAGDRVRDQLRRRAVEVHPPPGAVALEPVADVEVLLKVVAQREVEERPLLGGKLHR